MSGAGSGKTAKSTTVGRPKGITVYRQNVTGVTGTGGKMGKGQGLFKARTAEAKAAATKVGRNKKTK